LRPRHHPQAQRDAPDHRPKRLQHLHNGRPHVLRLQASLPFRITCPELALTSTAAPSSGATSLCSPPSSPPPSPCSWRLTPAPTASGTASTAAGNGRTSRSDTYRRPRTMMTSKGCGPSQGILSGFEGSSAVSQARHCTDVYVTARKSAPNAPIEFPMSLCK
ncbi:hypothetical protein PMIN01_09131, partial [Paraphaeosphaeria minitans]